MRWMSGVVLVAAVQIASADDALREADMRTALDAAAHEHCDVVLQIGARIEANDPDYYKSTFRLSHALARCFIEHPAPGNIDPFNPPPALAPTVVDERVATRRMYIGAVSE